MPKAGEENPRQGGNRKMTSPADRGGSGGGWWWMAKGIRFEAGARPIRKPI